MTNCLAQLFLVHVPVYGWQAALYQGSEWLIASYALTQQSFVARPDLSHDYERDWYISNLAVDLKAAGSIIHLV
jgi:hypothetical protein